MIRKSITIGISNGLEARPIAMLVQVASQYTSNIYLESFIYKLTAEHFSDVISGIERTFFLSLPQRIAAFLLDESAETGSDTLSITKESLARSIGSAREAVSRALKQMSSDGFIEVSRGNISIKNKSRLYQMINHS